MSFNGERRAITTQHCHIRGCPNNAYILYNSRRGEKIPICRVCQRRLMIEEEESKWKEFQISFQNERRYEWDGIRKNRI